jgi:hypothetical protein
MLLEFFEILNFADLLASLVDHLRVLILNGLQVDIRLQLIGKNKVIADPILLELIEYHRQHHN